MIENFYSFDYSDEKPSSIYDKDNFVTAEGYKVDSGSISISDSSNDWNVISGSLNSKFEFTEETYEDIFHRMMEKFNKRPIIEHKCHNCGGIIELDEDKHIFHCPYCNTTYAIGTNMINDKG